MAKVLLINKDEILDELRLAGWHASVSYDSKTDYEKIAKHCISAGHGTPTRSMRFLFEISEVSRAFSHEFVRHEIGVGKVQRSQRYVKEDGFGYVTPKSLEEAVVTLKLYDGTNHIVDITYNGFQDIVRQVYSQLIEQGIKAEDARYILSNATHTKIHVSFDWEGLLQFCYRRCCTRAQWEIRDVAYLIKKEVTEANEFLGNMLGAPCDRMGYCPEKPSCGRAPEKEKVLGAIELLKKYKETYGEI